MNKNQIVKIDTVLKNIPDDRFAIVWNFLYWVKDSEEVLTESEVSGLKESLSETSGISWEELKKSA